MRILLVAMSESIHTARWICQIADQGWGIYLFPSIDYGLTHRNLRDVIVYHSVYWYQHGYDRSVKFRGIPVFNKTVALLGRNLLRKLVPNYQVIQLKRLVDKIKPDIIHSLEIQHAGYITLDVKKLFDGLFPTWIVTNWGSDIYLFGRLSEHEPRIREVLGACDYYSCECQRDVSLARSYGFKGKVLPVFPNAGGFDLELVYSLRQPGPVSARRVIILKGYQHWAGRGLVGLRALERCANLLKGYEVVIYSASPDTVIAAELFSKSTGIPTTIVPNDTSYHDILKLQGRARISIGLSISDAISTSLLEAIVMGSFPIQSWTACADEWVEDGVTGILVPPEDPEIIEKAIRRALSDDELVDNAVEKNSQTARERLDYKMLKQKAIEMYKYVYEKTSKKKI